MTPAHQHIRDQIVPLLAPYVSRIRLIGSVARGETRPDSDVDLLVTLKPSAEHPALGLRWFALEHELSEHLGRPVELITEAALSTHLRPFIEQDAVVLYEG